MPRYRIKIAYNGSGLAGWQRQANGPSVQAAIEEAISSFAQEQPEVVGAGRTDAGVHAIGQVAHFDLTRDWPPTTVMNAINYHLKPAAIGLLDCQLVSTDFHARFSAIKRHYRYRILNRPGPAVLERGFVWHLIAPLNVQAMQIATSYLIGRHNFSSFRAARCQAASPLKTLDRLDVQHIDEEIFIEASARSFLHNQVRAMVGSLKLVGEGKWTPEDIQSALNACDRSAAGPTAPAEGLCLVGVDYSTENLTTD